MSVRRFGWVDTRNSDVIQQAIDSIKANNLGRRGTPIFMSSPVYNSQHGDIVIYNSSLNNGRVTLPTTSAADNGRSIIVCNTGTGTITVDGDSNVKIHGSATASITTYSATEFLQVDRLEWVILN